MFALVIGCGDPVGNAITQLGDSDVTIRRAAVRILGQQTTPDERVVTALAKAVGDRDADVRRRAILALGEMRTAATSSLPALKEALNDSDVALGRRAALAIQRISPNDPSFRPLLVAAIREGDGRTLLAIGAMGEDAAWAVPPLIGLLSHDMVNARALAARTLGRIGPKASDARAQLERLLRDSNAAVRGAAQDALDKIGARTNARRP
jgi:HEAT repeat protein